MQEKSHKKLLEETCAILEAARSHLRTMAADSRDLRASAAKSRAALKESYEMLGDTHPRKMTSARELDDFRLDAANAAAARRANHVKSLFRTTRPSLPQPLQIASLLQELLRQKARQPMAPEIRARLEHAVTEMIDLLKLLDDGEHIDGEAFEGMSNSSLASLMQHARTDGGPVLPDAILTPADLDPRRLEASREARSNSCDSLTDTHAPEQMAHLTPRERVVMERVVAGDANKKIAADLGVSQRTIEHHRQAVMRKMGAKSLAALVRMALSTLENQAD